MSGMWPDRIEGKTCAIDLPALLQPFPYMASALSMRKRIVEFFIGYFDELNASSVYKQILLESFVEVLGSHNDPTFWHIGNQHDLTAKLLPKVQEGINRRLQRKMYLNQWNQLTFEGSDNE